MSGVASPWKRCVISFAAPFYRVNNKYICWEKELVFSNAPMTIERLRIIYNGTDWEVHQVPRQTYNLFMKKNKDIHKLKSIVDNYLLDQSNFFVSRSDSDFEKYQLLI